MYMAGINKFKLSQDYSYLFPHHRYGWRRVIEEISKATNSCGYIYLEPFTERVFGYKKQDKHRVEIYKNNPWVGFVHEPPTTGIPGSALSVLLLTEEFRECLPNLKGIFCLTENQKQAYQNYPQLKNIPISSLKYPTSYSVPKWDINKLTYNVYEIGNHYRNPIIKDLRLKAAKQRISLNKKKDKIISDEEYDKILSNSIVLINYAYNVAASTTIVECMATNNPIFVNKARSVIEYLGEEYPNYFNNTFELYKLFLNKEKLNKKLIEANEYLKKIRPLTYENFIQDILNSEVYNSI